MTTNGNAFPVTPEYAGYACVSVCDRLWAYANHIAAYCLLNLLDDPALLAMAFC